MRERQTFTSGPIARRPPREEHVETARGAQNLRQTARLGREPREMESKRSELSGWQPQGGHEEWSAVDGDAATRSARQRQGRRRRRRYPGVATIEALAVAQGQEAQEGDAEDGKARKGPARSARRPSMETLGCQPEATRRKRWKRGRSSMRREHRRNPAPGASRGSTLTRKRQRNVQGGRRKTLESGNPKRGASRASGVTAVPDHALAVGRNP